MPAPLKATFFAFRRRGQAGVLTTAALVHAVLALATLASFGLANYTLFNSTFYGLPLIAADASALFIRMWVSALVLALVYILVTASFEAACLRWMIRGEAGRFGGFSLGGDTWRVFGGNLIWLVIAFAALVGVASLSGLIASSPLSSSIDPDAYALLVGFGPMALWALVLTPLGVRMGTGNATSVVRRRFRYLESWRVSERRVRALLASYLTLWLIWLLLFVPAFWGLRSALFEWMPDARYPNALSNHGRVLMACGLTLLYFLGNMLIVFLTAGVNARAVQAAVEDGKIEGVSANVAQVFD